MNLQDITTWTVSADHKASPKNENPKPQEKDFYLRKDEGASWGDFLYKEWNAFEQECKQHTYACSPTLVAGDYPAEMFDSPKYQGLYGTLWCDIEKDTYDRFLLHGKSGYQMTETRQYLQLKQPVKEQVPKEITERKTDLGLSNNIEPCPFCGGTEGEQVFLGRTEPDHYQITCICCAVRMKHDRKDKVIGIWNNRKPLEDHN